MSHFSSPAFIVHRCSSYVSANAYTYNFCSLSTQIAIHVSHPFACIALASESMFFQCKFSSYISHRIAYFILMFSLVFEYFSIITGFFFRFFFLELWLFCTVYVQFSYRCCMCTIRNYLGFFFYFSSVLRDMFLLLVKQLNVCMRYGTTVHILAFNLCVCVCVIWMNVIGVYSDTFKS